MKVLQINAVNAIKSTGRTCLEMSNYLKAKGHTCITAFSKGPSGDSEHEYRIGDNIDTKIHGLLSRLTGKQGYFSFLATKKLLVFMDDYKPDIVLLRNLHGNYINVPALLKYLAKKDIPTVAVLHDCWFFTGKCCHYTEQGCYKWQNTCGKCPQLKKYNRSWFFDKTKTMLEDKKKLFGAIPRLAVVGVSNWLTNIAKQAPVFKKAKEIKRIYNWIDLDKIKPVFSDEIRNKLGLSDKKVILCVASLWSYDKGLKTVLKLSEKLSEKEKIVMVGKFPASIQLNDKIISVPSTDSIEELVELYSMADVFFQPSLEETFGKVSAEALSCGTPVVCFNSTANPEIVGEGCGSSVAVGDIDGLYNEIQNILSKDKSVYSKGCREFAKKNFNMEKNLPEYMQLFEKISK